jgi:phosphatidylglycerol lysyltransferase
VPCYKTGEATIDLMRHDSVAPGSTMDFLFICLLKHFYAEGRKTFNFGGVPLSGIEEKSNKTPEEIALRGFYLYFNNFFSFKGLKYFKDKFEPEWHSQFLVYQDGLSGLAKLGMALRKLSKF